VFLAGTLSICLRSIFAYCRQKTDVARLRAAHKKFAWNQPDDPRRVKWRTCCMIRGNYNCVLYRKTLPFSIIILSEVSCLVEK
jgi:hypothetical protein